MLNLLKADLYRIKKDKVILICAILLFGMAIATSLLSYILYGKEGLSFRSNVLSMINLSGTMSIFVSVIIATFCGKEFSHGTIRNKIICGKSKVQIYLASLISSTIVCLILFTGSIILFGLFGGILGGYDYEVAYSTTDLVFMLKSVIMGYVLLLVYTTICHFGIFVIKSVAIDIVGSFLLLSFGCEIVYLLQNKFTGKIFTNLIQLTFFSQINYLADREVTNMIFAKCLLSSVALIAILILVGIKIFKKTDLK